MASHDDQDRPASDLAASIDTQIHEVTASSEEVNACIDTLIGPALEGVKREVGICAMLTCVMLAMYPEMSEADLIEGLRDISGYIVTFISSKVNPTALVN